LLGVLHLVDDVLQHFGIVIITPNFFRHLEHFEKPQVLKVSV